LSILSSDVIFIYYIMVLYINIIHTLLFSIFFIKYHIYNMMSSYILFVNYI